MTKTLCHMPKNAMGDASIRALKIVFALRQLPSKCILADAGFAGYTPDS
ncbi:MAG: hypothetical protein QW520_02475 [Methanomassiliicoccales archaeon]